MSDYPNNPEVAADPAAADGPDQPPIVPLSAEQEQAEALNVVDDADPVDPAAAVAGEDVESAEEALGEQDPNDYKDLYLRGAADLDNFRKRSRRDIAAAQDRGIGKLAKELLPAIDNLERALQAAEAAGESSQDLVQGLRLVQAELVGAFSRAGVSVEDPKGEPFDPHRHEALAQAPGPEGTASGTVVEVYQPGYVLGDTVLRAARVVVSS